MIDVYKRQVNSGYKYNAQKDTLPLLGFINDKFEKDGYLLTLISEKLGVDKDRILDFDLFLYEYEKGCIFGLEDEFISAGRLDDLWMVFCGVKALLNSKESKSTKVMIAIDNEEIGSLTAVSYTHLVTFRWVIWFGGRRIFIK